MRQALLTTLVLAVLAARSAAHDGPPYPIIVDQPFGDRTLSVWADPDVGIGTFYVYIPEEADGPLDDDPRITATVQPSDGRLEEAEHVAERADSGRPYQRIIHADFDKRGFWQVRFSIDNATTPNEISSEINVTPPGIGRLDLLWFLTPFLLIAFLWGKAVLQRRSYERATQQ